MALIELTEFLGSSNLVICLDRRMDEQEARELMKSLSWVGFGLISLDHWAHDLDVISEQWLFMGMEV
jgi:hypothetical protein